MTELERIQSIKDKCGRHLQNFKEENITYAMCLVAVEMDGSAIEFVPDKFKTEEMYRIACKTFGRLLRTMPKEYVTEEACKEAVASDGFVLRDIPEECRTEELYNLTAYGTPEIWKEIPEKYITIDVCISQYKRKKEAIRYLPKSLQNKDFYFQLVVEYPDIVWDIPKAERTLALLRKALQRMGKTVAEIIQEDPELFPLLHPSLYDHDTCLAFIESSFFKKAVKNIYGFSHCGFNNVDDFERGMLSINAHQRSHKIPYRKIMHWSDVCVVAIQAFPISVAFIDERLLTLEMCFNALERDAKTFKYIPEKYRTKELCLLAVDKDKSLVREIPEEFATYELYLTAVSCSSGITLAAVPPKYRDREMCLASLKSGGLSTRHSFEHVPRGLIDEELCLEAIQCSSEHDTRILSYIPEVMRTYPICLAAVKKNSLNFSDVPTEHRTYELCLIAAKGGATIDNIKEEYYTEELCLAMVQYSDSKFEKIPKHKLTEKICLQAISKGSRYGGTVLRRIPKEIVTLEMCNKSVEICPRSFCDVPDEFVTVQLITYIAKVAPGCLSSNFPKRYRTEPFIQCLIAQYPDAEKYVSKFLPNGIFEG